jgi:hypothetical protein
MAIPFELISVFEIYIKKNLSLNYIKITKFLLQLKSNFREINTLLYSFKLLMHASIPEKFLGKWKKSLFQIQILGFNARNPNPDL